MTRLLGPLVGLALFIVAVAVTEAIKREYDRWAPALARRLVRVAGWIFPARAEEWNADVLYLQRSPGAETGLWEASCDLLGAPKLLGLAASRFAWQTARRTVGEVRSVNPKSHRVFWICAKMNAAAFILVLSGVAPATPMGLPPDRGTPVVPLRHVAWEHECFSLPAGERHRPRSIGNGSVAEGVSILPPAPRCSLDRDD